MNRQDYFAGLAMQALMRERFARIRRDEIGRPWTDDEIARDAIDIAEAMNAESIKRAEARDAATFI